MMQNSKTFDYSNFFSNLIIKFASGVAEKTNPELWSQAKSQASLGVYR